VVAAGAWQQQLAYQGAVASLFLTATSVLPALAALQQQALAYAPLQVVGVGVLAAWLQLHPLLAA